MSTRLHDPDEARGPLRVRGAEDEARAERRLSAVLADLAQADGDRPDERTRAHVSAAMARLGEAVERGLRLHAGRLLAAHGLDRLAARVSGGDGIVDDPHVASALLSDRALVAELFQRARFDLIASGLSPAPGEDGGPALLARLAGDADSVVAAGARALMTATSRRRLAGSNDPTATDLPAELHHRLVWHIAAALGEAHAFDAADDGEALDRALTDAALRMLAAHDEGERLEAAAVRLATAIDAPPAAREALLIDALDDRRIELFAALIGVALGLGFDLAADIVLDRVADRLWLALRALDVSRTGIARIGLALCDAEPARDIEAFADRVDTIMAVSPAEARAALAPLRLHPDYRAAMLALARARR